MNQILLTASFLALVLNSLATSAQIGPINFAGCPSEVTWLSDESGKNNIVKIVPESFRIASKLKKLSRVTCNLIIPILGKPNVKYVIAASGFLGSASLPSKNVLLTATHEAFWAGTIGPKGTKSVKGPFKDILSSTVFSNIESGCGLGSNLRLNSSAILNVKKKLSSEAVVKIDQVVIQIAEVPCN